MLRDGDLLRYLDGGLSAEEMVRFSGRLAADAALVDRLVELAVVDDVLSQHAEACRGRAHAQWVESFVRRGQESCPGSGNTIQKAEIETLPKRRLSFGRGTVLLTAAAVVVGLLVGFWRGSDPDPSPVSGPPAVGVLTRAVNVQWEAGAERWAIGDPLLAGDVLRLADGRAEITFDSGAVMTVSGPAAATLTSYVEVELHHGTVRSRFDGSSTSVDRFRVLTPSSEVVDLGTEFGIRVHPTGKTEAVVFDGEINLTPLSSGRGARFPSRILSQGEGLRVNAAGLLERVVSVHSDAFPFGDGMFRLGASRPPVILSVSDDRRSTDSPKFYEIHWASFDEDVRAYVDRTHEWNGLTQEGIPYFLRGADYIATFNDDGKRLSPTITVELAGPAMLYLIVDDRTNIPGWLAGSFEYTGFKIGRDEGPSRNEPNFEVAAGPGNSIDRICSVWSRRVDTSGFVEIGPVDGSGNSMLGIAAQPLPSP